ncbi:DhaKLM operon coactivator DhaQ [Streptococcus massiliensis]|uniref:DhaKLM operon coactivator DhaQ n=1 Tax=Streptococcus massiliensis TaxID=313439 RepID=A0A380KYU1_9STRE|nr:DhaKLM operon coactivator DhaQ [Streptococcus massiliensis]SUN76888.1 putative dihydroxyacetone kinase [Streptococcus massiliensis]
MTHILNSLESSVQQNIQALTRIYPHLSQLDNRPVLYNNQHDIATVPILSGGGSGHEPAHFGYVGDGMLSAAIAGPLFIPPKSDDILETIRFLNKGKGVFVIIKNFDADLAEFSSAIHQARAEGIAVKYIISHDDISVETSNFQVRHRGVAGTILLHKILGQAAKEGADLDELEELGLSLSTSIATLGVASRPASLPDKEQLMFELPEKYISYGIGIHGEPGYRTVLFESSENLAVELVNKLKMRFKWQETDDFILLINNLGGISKLEEWAFTDDVLQLLDLERLHLSFIKTGHLITTLDMAGLSITLCAVKDPTWIRLLIAPTNAAAW